MKGSVPVFLKFAIQRGGSANFGRPNHWTNVHSRHIYTKKFQFGILSIVGELWSCLVNFCSIVSGWVNFLLNPGILILKRSTKNLSYQNILHRCIWDPCLGMGGGQKTTSPSPLWASQRVSTYSTWPNLPENPNWPVPAFWKARTLTVDEKVHRAAGNHMNVSNGPGKIIEHFWRHFTPQISEFDTLYWDMEVNLVHIPNILVHLTAKWLKCLVRFIRNPT